MQNTTLPILTSITNEAGISLRYDLYRGVFCRNDENYETYSITVTEESNGGIQTCMLLDVSENYNKAAEIVNQLSVNLVTPCHAEELIDAFI